MAHPCVWHTSCGVGGKCQRALLSPLLLLLRAYVLCVVAPRRELLAAGFKVRAAARDVEQAKANTDIAVQFGLIAPDQLSRLQWVEMDLEDPDSIRPAIGGAAKVGRGLVFDCLRIRVRIRGID